MVSACVRGERGRGAHRGRAQHRGNSPGLHRRDGDRGASRDGPANLPLRQSRTDAGRDGRGVRGAAALGADYRLHWHPRHLRRLRPGRGHPARQQPGARADRSPGGPGSGAAAARVLRLYRIAHADRIGERRWGVAAVPIDHRDRVAGQIRGRSGRGPPDRSWLARLGRAWRADEHARADGTDRAQYRLRTRRDLTHAVRNAGADGVGDHLHDHTDSSPSGT